MAQTTLKTSPPLVAKTYSDPRCFNKTWLLKNIKSQYGVYINRSMTHPSYFRIGSGGVNGSTTGLHDRVKQKTTKSPHNLTEVLYPWAPVWIMQIQAPPNPGPDRYTNCWKSLLSPPPPCFVPRSKSQIAYKILACEHLLFGKFAQEHYFADNSILEFNPCCLKSSSSPALDLPEPNNTPVLTWPNAQTGGDIQTQNQILINSANSLVQQLEDILNL